jgi:tRNA-dihydrouridine synthase
VIDRLRQGVEGVLVGRGVLRNPWILAQAADIAAGRPPREVTIDDRRRFLLEYIELLTQERVHDDPRLGSVDSLPGLGRASEAAGFRHTFVAQDFSPARVVAQDVSPAHQSSNAERRTPNVLARGHDRWVINKIRALGSWYTKGLDNGSHLRTAINTAESLDQLRDIVSAFFSGNGRVSESELLTLK